MPMDNYDTMLGMDLMRKVNVFSILLFNSFWFMGQLVPCMVKAMISPKR